ncbi:transposase domain-containing protein [Paenibacillus sp. YIM B09110]|uniref:transposase domain-containing protein n=1 Tax=Paenibacillus sp. YIM B09110 TaxID=3126102 RepID=UPI003FA70928
MKQWKKLTAFLQDGRLEIETAKENGLNPFRYLMYLFEQPPQLPGLANSGALDNLYFRGLPRCY